MKLCNSEDTHEIFVVLDHNPASSDIKAVLQSIIKSVNQSKNIKVSFVDAKPRLALEGKFDLVYAGLMKNFYTVGA